MKKIFLFSVLFISFSAICIGQGVDKKQLKEEAREKIEALRKGYINDKLGLTASEAQVFWPIYDEYRQKEKDLMAAMRPNKKGKKAMADMTEAEANTFILNQMKLDEEKLALRRTYYMKLQKEISAKKLVRLKRAEKSFKAEVVRRVKEKRGQNRGDRPNGPRKQD